MCNTAVRPPPPPPPRPPVIHRGPGHTQPPTNRTQPHTIHTQPYTNHTQIRRGTRKSAPGRLQGRRGARARRLQKRSDTNHTGPYRKHTGSVQESVRGTHGFPLPGTPGEGSGKGDCPRPGQGEGKRPCIYARSRKSSSNVKERSRNRPELIAPRRFDPPNPKANCTRTRDGLEAGNRNVGSVHRKTAVCTEDESGKRAWACRPPERSAEYCGPYRTSAGVLLFSNRVSNWICSRCMATNSAHCSSRKPSIFSCRARISSSDFKLTS
jgi:hypothetical protein